MAASSYLYHVCLAVALMTGASDCTYGMPDVSFGITNHTDATSQGRRSLGSGRLPSFVLQGNRLSFNGTHLQFGQPLNVWKRILGGSSECSPPSMPPQVCRWDELGLMVGAYAATGAVSYINIHLRPYEKPDFLSEDQIDPFARGPREAFPGRVVIDGIAIDSQLRFRDILPRIDRSRQLRCGLRDCIVAEGIVDETTQLSFELTGRHDTSTINTVSLWLSSRH